MYTRVHVKRPLFLPNFSEICISSTYFRKKTQISNFIKVRPVGAQLFHPDGQTDMTTLKVACLNFANVPLLAYDFGNIRYRISYFWVSEVRRVAGNGRKQKQNVTMHYVSALQYLQHRGPNR